MGREEKIMAYIRDELLDDPETELSFTTSLFQGRVLDSLTLVTLLSFLEKTFSIKIKTSEVTVDNLDSIENMIAFLDKKGVK